MSITNFVFIERKIEGKWKFIKELHFGSAFSSMMNSIEASDQPGDLSPEVKEALGKADKEMQDSFWGSHIRPKSFTIDAVEDAGRKESENYRASILRTIEDTRYNDILTEIKKLREDLREATDGDAGVADDGVYDYREEVSGIFDEAIQDVAYMDGFSLMVRGISMGPEDKWIYSVNPEDLRIIYYAE